MKKILILDTKENRHETFEKIFKFPEYYVFHAYYDYEAINMLINFLFDEIYLDHELGDDQDINKVIDCILQLSNFDSKIFIHSTNLNGINNILQNIKNKNIAVTHIPFNNFAKLEYH